MSNTPAKSRGFYIMKFIELDMAGCYLIKPSIIVDIRGSFVKTLNREIFEKKGLCSEFEEEYFSISKKNVLRGMHFQKPPYDHVKLVYCLDGCVEDVFLDIRKNSETYLKHQKIELESETRGILYLPKGIAHGFLTKSDSATMVYKTSSCYAPWQDDGILWDSFGAKWSCDHPIISSRDTSFSGIHNYSSPFV